MAKTGKKRNKVQMPAGIRNKLMAAVSMLMVSCIMLVSSTYAWFTLSTAPEITGITTNVGANGNLEMMLLNKDSYNSEKENLGVESKVGDSSAHQAVTLANETWGNLVDLSSSSYGLSSVRLMPAKLSISEDAKTINGEVLRVPSYGRDGRVIEVNTPAMTGAYATSWTYDAEAVGVRALGTSSGTTLRLSEYQNALAQVTSYASKAQLSAQSSLKANAQDLADLLINKAQGATEFDDKYLDNIDSIINGVTEANENVEMLIKNALLAYGLSATGGGDDLSDEAVNQLKDNIMSDTFDITNIPATITVPDSVASAITVYEDTQDALETALAERASITGGTVTWEALSPALDPLVAQDKMSVSGAKLEDGKDAVINAVSGDVFAGNPIPIMMLEDSGVYYNIAKICGAYVVADTVHVTFSGGGMSIDQDVRFTMTQSINDEADFTIITNFIKNNGGAPEVDLGGSNSIALSDTYGYMLDFGFRTNAAGSKLLLQSGERQRVYTTGEAETTMGGGTYMQFKTVNPVTYSLNEVQGLMSAIRVAFVTPNITETGTTYTLLALAAPAITGVTDQTTGLTTYSGGTPSDSDGDGTDDTIKASLQLYECSYNTTNGTIEKGALKENNFEITALDQNVAAKVSVIVYLDGNIVDNTMVANANDSMSGNLNLQFSSDAALVPMENAGMLNGGQASIEEPEQEVNYTQKYTAGQTLTWETYSGTVNEGYTIWEADRKLYYTTVTSADTYVEITASNIGSVITQTP